MSLFFLLNPRQYIRRAAEPIAARRAKADKKRKHKASIITKAEDLIVETIVKKPEQLSTSAFSDGLLQQFAGYIKLQLEIDNIQQKLKALYLVLQAESNELALKDQLLLRETAIGQIQNIKQLRAEAAKRMLEMQEEEEAMIMLLMD